MTILERVKRMTKLEAIRLIVDNSHYSTEKWILLRISNVLEGMPPEDQVDIAVRYEQEVQAVYESLLVGNETRDSSHR